MEKETDKSVTSKRQAKMFKRRKHTTNAKVKNTYPTKKFDCIGPAIKRMFKKYSGLGMSIA